jgi:hypothetical protein
MKNIVNNHGKWIGTWRPCPLKCKRGCIIRDVERVKISMSKLSFADWLDERNYQADGFVFSRPRWNPDLSKFPQAGGIEEIADATMPAEYLNMSYEFKKLANAAWISLVRQGYSYAQAWELVTA